MIFFRMDITLSGSYFYFFMFMFIFISSRGGGGILCCSLSCVFVQKLEMRQENCIGMHSTLSSHERDVYCTCTCTCTSFK